MLGLSENSARNIIVSISLTVVSLAIGVYFSIRSDITSMLEITLFIFIFVATICFSINIVFYLYILRLHYENKNISLIQDYDSLYDIMYRKRNSVIKSADSVINITGSKSREELYLKTIENKLYTEKNIKHTRVLFGDPKEWSPQIRDHIEKLLELRSNETNTGSQGNSRITILHITDTNSYPERHLISSEKSAIFVTQSINQVSGFDTGFLVQRPAIADRLCLQITALKTVSTQIRTVAELKHLLGDHPHEA